MERWGSPSLFWERAPMTVQQSEGAQDSRGMGKMIRADIGGCLHVLNCASTADDRDDFLRSHGFVPGRDQYTESEASDAN